MEYCAESKDKTLKELLDKAGKADMGATLQNDEDVREDYCTIINRLMSEET